MTVEYVPAARAGALTEQRVVEILDSKLSSELDSEQNRNADDRFVDPDSGRVGVPLPDAEEYFFEPSPSQQHMLEASSLALFTGQIGDPEFGDYRNSANGRLVDTHVPWAVSFVFARLMGGPDVSHPVLSRDMHYAEVVNTRAQRYRDTVSHTIEKWGKLGSGTHPRAHAIKSTEITADLSTVARITVGETDNDLRAVGYIEFTIDQWRLYPAKSTT